jgi:hypothetical protein
VGSQAVAEHVQPLLRFGSFFFGPRGSQSGELLTDEWKLTGTSPTL